jgi:hypothetical protein
MDAPNSHLTPIDAKKETRKFNPAPFLQPLLSVKSKRSCGPIPFTKILFQFPPSSE